MGKKTLPDPLPLAGHEGKQILLFIEIMRKYLEMEGCRRGNRYESLDRIIERAEMTCLVRSVLVGIVFLAVCLFGGCITAPQQAPTVPLSEEEIEFLKKLDDPESGTVIVDTPVLFFRLNNLIREWQNASVNKDSWKQLKIQSNLGSILTRYVYLNFDKITHELENGPQPNRVTAAAALGFCRIPDSDDFPQRYPEAIQALLRALESGDDAITQNALLGLTILGEPDTPLELILPLMTRHHDPEVRSNAALCISVVVKQDEADQVMPYVLPALRDDDPKVRNHAILIIRIIRVNAARTLGDLGDIEACGPLIMNLEHPKESVKHYCLEALQKLSGENYGMDQERWQDWWTEYRDKSRRD
jgi:hypothetical protein